MQSQVLESIHHLNVTAA